MAKYSVSETFTPHFNALARIAYFKLKSKEESNLKSVLYEMYRFVMWFFILLYNIQHIIRVIQVRHSSEQMIDTLFILLTTLNCLFKQVAFNVRSHRVNKIIDIMDEPVFAPTKPYHYEVVKKNAISMSRLLKLYQVAALSSAVIWGFFPIFNRAIGMEVTFTGYLPIRTNDSPNFQLAVVYMSILIIIQAYGNVSMDCTIVGFYAQAKVQIQMLRYNLEHLIDVDDEVIKIDARITKTNNGRNSDIHNANDSKNNVTQERLAVYANHYKEITGFVKEVESIFAEAMIFQFLSMAWVLCMTVYKIVALISLLELISIIMYLGCMLAQFFIYCYSGTELKVESEYINQSAYCSNWTLLSPKLRRQLFLLMTFCSKPIALRTAYIIPVSVDSYITVLRSSYTLYTFLDRK